MDDDEELYPLGETGIRFSNDPNTGFFRKDDSPLDWDGLGALTEDELGDVARRTRLISEAQSIEHTLSIINSLDQFDPTIHWIDWEAVGAEGEPTVAHCGAVVYDGTQWLSMPASSDKLAEVTCPHCQEIPEYGVRLLAEADLGDVTAQKKLAMLPDGKIVSIGALAEVMELPSGMFEALDAIMYGLKKK